MMYLIFDGVLLVRGFLPRTSSSLHHLLKPLTYTTTYSGLFCLFKASGVGFVLQHTIRSCKRLEQYARFKMLKPREGVNLHHPENVFDQNNCFLGIWVSVSIFLHSLRITCKGCRGLSSRHPEENQKHEAPTQSLSCPPIPHTSQDSSGLHLAQTKSHWHHIEKYTC